MDVFDYLLARNAGSGGGGGGGVMYVVETINEQTDVATLNKTAGEIIAAINQGAWIVIVQSDTWPINTDSPGEYFYASYVATVGYADGVWIISTEAGANYAAAALDDYPELQQDGGDGR